MLWEAAETNRAFYALNACLTVGEARLQAFHGKDLQANPCGAVQLFQS
jgi:hypothetical protein